MTYIGEILYASDPSTSGREEGLAWTREAVDIAEEELRGRGTNENKEAKATCRQCLETGLGNWGKMVARLAREERERRKGDEEARLAKSAARAGGWFGFGAGAGMDHDAKEREQKTGPAGPAEALLGPMGRWEAEELVVQERMRRARDVLESGGALRGESGLFFM